MTMLRFEVKCPRCGKKEEINYKNVHCDVYGTFSKLGWQSFSKKKTMICRECCLEYCQLEKIHNQDQEIEDLDKELAEKLQIEKKKYIQKCEKLKKTYENRINELREEKSDLLQKFWP